jgi:RNA recognition motif-containing protein
LLLVTKINPMATIYVGNLPFSATEADLRCVFEKHGSVKSVVIINDRDTGEPRGFAFVNMLACDAPTAIARTNGTDMSGRPLRVNEARDREVRRAPRPMGRK